MKKYLRSFIIPIFVLEFLRLQNTSRAAGFLLGGGSGNGWIGWGWVRSWRSLDTWHQSFDLLSWSSNWRKFGFSFDIIFLGLLLLYKGRSTLVSKKPEIAARWRISGTIDFFFLRSKTFIFPIFKFFTEFKMVHFLKINK